MTNKNAYAPRLPTQQKLKHLSVDALPYGTKARDLTSIFR